MRKVTCLLAVVALVCVTPTYASQTLSYGWEDGVGTILGSYGNLVDPLNVASPVHSGDRALQVTEAPHYSTPQAYVAWITGLNDGDVISADFWAYDDTPGGSPSVRIWGHWGTSTDITDYRGSASGPYDYSGDPNDVWSNMSHSWTFEADPNDATKSSLIVEYRLYSTPSTDPNGSTDYWCDDITVTAPDGATIHFAPEPGSLLLLFGMGALAFRRRWYP